MTMGDIIMEKNRRKSKANKVLKSFALFKRSMGVILSGDKGIGKSLFARWAARC